jgi:uncharacterized protein
MMDVRSQAAFPLVWIIVLSIGPIAEFGFCGENGEHSNVNERFLLINGIRLYQEYLSSIRGRECPMIPSCSEYGIESIRKFGIIGLFLAADRINRCGKSTEIYDEVFLSDHAQIKVRFHDPPCMDDHISEPRITLRTLTCLEE